MSHGRYREAISALSTSTTRPSTTTHPLGQAYFDAGQLKKAQKTLAKAARTQTRCCWLRSISRWAASKARRTYKAFLTYHPEHPKAERARQRLRLL